MQRPLEKHGDGTSSVDVDPDLRRRRDSTSDVRRRVSARYGGRIAVKAAVDKNT